MTIFERYGFITNKALANGTVVIVDNKTTGDYECYKVDRNEVPEITEEYVREELFNDDTYLIRVYEDGVEVLEVR